MASAESRLLFPGLSFIGTKTSAEYVHADPRNANAVDVEMWPDDSSGTALATAVVLDSFDPAAGFNPVTDTAYTLPSGGPNSLTAITSYQKVRIGSVMEYVRVKITIASGTWYVRVTPLTAVSGPTTITNTASQNLTQVAGAAIALGQTTKSASLPVTLASDQGAMTVASTPAAPVDVRLSGLTWATDLLSVTTGSAVALTSHPCKVMYLENLASSTQNLLWGDAVNQNFILTPGAKLFLGVLNTNQVYVKWALSTANVNWGYLGGTAG